VYISSVLLPPQSSFLSQSSFEQSSNLFIRVHVTTITGALAFK